MFRSFKRLIFLIALSCLVAMPVYATDADPTDGGNENPTTPTETTGSEHYDQLMDVLNGNYYQYYARQQPDDAIILKNEVVLTQKSISTNYTSGVIDLPRLKHGYYYVFDSASQVTVDNFGLALGQTTYPSMTWKNTIEGTGVQWTLEIHERGNAAAICSTTFKLADGVSLPGTTTAVVDVSKDIMKHLALCSNPSINTTTDVKEYPAIAHKYCIISSNVVVYDPDEVNTVNDLDLAEFLLQHPNNIGTVSATTYGNSHLPVTEDYPEYWTNSTSITRTTYVLNSIESANLSAAGPTDVTCFFSDYSTLSFDSNKLEVTSTINSTAHPILDSETSAMYAVVYGNYFDVYRIANDKYTGDFDTVDSSARIYECNYGESFDLLSLIGRKDLELWAMERANENSFETQNYPTITYINSGSQQYNVYASSIAYNGIKDHVGTLSAKASTDSVIFKLYYKLPEETEYKLLQTITKKINDTSPITQKPTEVVQDYSWDGWYLDASCKQPFDAATYMTTNVESKVGKTTYLYSQYEYSGGSYTVQYYNDYKNTYISDTYETRYLPVLPSSPTRPGYKFKGWIIVTYADDDSGIPYSPETFMPVSGTTYIFKTAWSISGLIVDVTSSKDTYYVGDTIDKASLSVTIQTDDTGSTRTLSSSEFSINPKKCQKAGTNKITVTYNAVGVSRVIELYGTKVEPKSITATYNGSALSVGSSIDKGNITVKANMNNGTTKILATSDFSISPTTISSSGTNSIHVTYKDCTTTVNISGSTSSSSSSSSNGSSSRSSSGYSSSNKTLMSISAVYRGKMLKVGDKLVNTDFTVTARYTDGTSEIVQPTAFTLTPDYIRNEGANAIVITYNGKTCTINLQASAADSSSTTGGGSGGTAGGTTPRASGTPTPVPSGTPAAGGTGTAYKPGGTSSAGYLNGSNVLSNRLYSDVNTSVNEVDIASEIDTQTEKGSNVSVTLYNTASGNDITADMLQKLIDKKATMTVTMLDPNDKVTVLAKWVFDGNTLTSDTVTSINPNVNISKKDKNDGMELVTFLSVQNQPYPEGVSVQLFPPANNYDVGEFVTLYSVDYNGGSSRRISDMSWTGSANDAVLPKLREQVFNYALSNAASAYPDDSDLTLDINTLEMDEEEEDLEEDDTSEEESFDWGDDLNETPLAENPQVKKSNKLPIIIGLGALALVALGAIGFVIYKMKAGQSAGSDDDDDVVDYDSDSDDEEDSEDIFDDEDGEEDDESEEEEEE